MYSDGDRKTVSELQREAEATRNSLVEEAHQLERLKKATAKTQFSIDQLFRFFAREAETEEEKKTLVDILLNNSPDLHVECVPLMPVVTAIANGRMTNARRLYAGDNEYANDSTLIYLAHVLRFSPQAAQIEYLDISGTRVTEKGMCFLLEMMIERETNFTLVARHVLLPPSTATPLYQSKYKAALQAAQTRKYCEVILE